MNGPRKSLTVYRGFAPFIDGTSVVESDVEVMLSIVVAEPAAAAGAVLSFPGPFAFHFYTLAIYTNDLRYASILQTNDLPVEFVNRVSYRRPMDDATGVGDISVVVPSNDRHSRSSTMGRAIFSNPAG